MQHKRKNSLCAKSFLERNFQGVFANFNFNSFHSTGPKSRTLKKRSRNLDYFSFLYSFCHKNSMKWNFRLLNWDWFGSHLFGIKNNENFILSFSISISVSQLLMEKPFSIIITGLRVYLLWESIIIIILKHRAYIYWFNKQTKKRLIQS